MRRADRLFQIIQILRRSTRPVTAAEIATELEVSKRSVYRDIADLVGQRVPVQGEAGLGYVLDGGFDMPPLALTPDEIEAAVLGAQLVAERSDAQLANAARDLVAKITQSIPQHLRPFITEPSVSAPPRLDAPRDGLDMVQTRLWIRTGRKIRIGYEDTDGKRSERVIWPVILGYAETVRLLAAWCELRNDFRHFRTDRIRDAEFIDERYPGRSGDLRIRWKRHFEAERGIRLP